MIKKKTMFLDINDNTMKIFYDFLYEPIQNWVTIDRTLYEMMDVSDEIEYIEDDRGDYHLLTRTFHLVIA